MSKTLNILLADDDPDDHLFFEEALKRAHIGPFLLHKVFTGKQALDYLSGKGIYSHTPEQSPDLLVLDLNMPEMDGYKTLEAIKADRENSNLPVYILTTSAEPNDRKRAIALGAAGFYTKPITISDLESIIESIVSDAHH